MTLDAVLKLRATPADIAATALRTRRIDVLGAVQLAGRSGARIWLFDYGVHRCAALACFTPTDAAWPRLVLAFLVSYRTLAALCLGFQGRFACTAIYPRRSCKIAVICEHMGHSISGLVC